MLISIDYQGPCWYYIADISASFLSSVRLWSGLGEMDIIQLDKCNWNTKIKNITYIILCKPHYSWHQPFPNPPPSTIHPSTGIPWLLQTQWRWLKHCEWDASAWTSAAKLGIIEINGDVVEASWRPRKRKNCTFCGEKKRHNKTATKTYTYTSFIFVVQKSLHLLYKSKPFQYEHSSTLAFLFKHLYLPNLFHKFTVQTHLQLPAPNYINLHHTPSSPAWQVPLDDTSQGLRLENRLTTRDPSRFWPGWRMQRRLQEGEMLI